MLSQFVDPGPGADAVLAPPREGGAATEQRVEAPPSVLRRTLVALTDALAATRRGLGD